MVEQENSIEKLIETATEYGISTYELLKLKAIDKIADVVSTILPHYIVLVLIGVFVLFLNLGISFWLGEIFGNIYYGFLVVAGFYGITGAIIHFFFHKRIKRNIANNIVKQLIK